MSETASTPRTTDSDVGLEEHGSLREQDVRISRGWLDGPTRLDRSKRGKLSALIGVQAREIKRSHDALAALTERVERAEAAERELLEGNGDLMNQLYGRDGENTRLRAALEGLLAQISTDAGPAWDPERPYLRSMNAETREAIAEARRVVSGSPAREEVSDAT